MVGQAGPSQSGTLSAADRLDIHQLIAGEYFLHEDNGNFEAWADLFTTDGSFHPAGRAPIVGRKNLLEFARRRWEERPEVRNVTHWISNVVIRPMAGGAEAYSYQMNVDRRDGEVRITGLSGKSDELRREEGKWRFFIRRGVELNTGWWPQSKI